MSLTYFERVVHIFRYLYSFLTSVSSLTFNDFNYSNLRHPFRTLLRIIAIITKIFCYYWIKFLDSLPNFSIKYQINKIKILGFYYSELICSWNKSFWINDTPFLRVALNHFHFARETAKERRVVELIGTNNDGKLRGDYLWLIMECALVISAKHARFRDNRRLTMTLPLVNIAHARLSTATYNKRTSSFSPDPSLPDDLSATNRFAIAISPVGGLPSRWALLQTFAWIF